MNYRIKRRAFMASVGGALGLRAMLDNMTAIAQGQRRRPVS